MVTLYCELNEGKTPLHQWIIANEQMMVEEFLVACKDDACRARFLNSYDAENQTSFWYALSEEYDFEDNDEGMSDESSYSFEGNGNEDLVRVCLSAFQNNEIRYDFLTCPIDPQDNEDNYFMSACVISKTDVLRAILEYFAKDHHHLERLLSLRDKSF